MPLAIWLLLFIPFVWEGTALQPYALVLLLFLGLLAWLLFHQVTRYRFYIPKLIFLLVALFALKVVLLKITPVPPSVYRELITNLALILFFAFFVDVFKHGWPVSLWQNFLIILGLVVSLVAIIFSIWRQYEWLLISGPPISLIPTGLRLKPLLFNHANNAAGFLNFVIPLCIAGILGNGGLWKKIYLSFAMFIFLAFSYLTSSRGGWLGLFAGLLVMTGLVFWQRSNQGVRNEGLFGFLRAHMKNWKRWWLALPLVFLLFLFAASFIYLIAIRGDSNRLSLWQKTFQAVVVSPILGRGPNSHPFLITQIGLTPADIGVYYHPHNVLLMFLEDAGIIGVITLLIGIYFLGRAWWASWRSSEGKPGNQILLAAYAGAITAAGVQGLVDYLFSNILYSLIFLIILAFIFSNAPDGEFIWPFGRFYQVLAFLAVLSLGVSYWFIYPSSRLYSQGVQDINAGDWPNGRDLICAAARMQPGMTGYAFQCAQAYTITSLQDGNSIGLPRAAEMVADALNQDGYFFMHWMDYAAIEWRLGDKATALQHMRQAASLAPDWAIVQLNLGWMAEQLGYREEAIRAYFRAGCLDPLYKTSLLFQKSQYYDLLKNDTCSEVPMCMDPAAYPFYLASYESLGEMDYRTALSSWKN
jgi:O-antigen ligase